MITASNIVRHDGIPFSEYLALPGYSHSFLKYQKRGIMEPKEATQNMMVGSIVDAILSDPSAADMTNPLYQYAKQIAADLRREYDYLIKRSTPQACFTGEFNCNGFTMATKGRLDFLLEEQAVIDLKVTWSRDVKALINYMGYLNQVYGYGLLAGVKKAYILIYSVPLKKSHLFAMNITGTNEFWNDSIASFGTVKQIN